MLVVSSDFEELLGLCERVVVISDGRSTAEAPACDVDEERLTLLAAPRSSMPRMQALLARLAQNRGGTCLWGVEDGDDLVCLPAPMGRGRTVSSCSPAKAFGVTN